MKRRGVLASCFIALVTVAVAGYLVNVALAATKPNAPTITSSPANPTMTATTASATFAFTDSSGLTFKCSLDSAAYAACTSPKTYTALAQGTHSFSVEAFSGTTASNATTYSWEIVPPTPTIVSHPANPTGSTSATFTYADTQSGVAFKCSLDGATFNTCASSGITYTGLAGGNHTFAVESQHGTTPPSTAATFAWTVDRTAPTITLTFPVNGRSYNAAGWSAGCSPAGICGTATDPSGVANVGVAILQQSTNKYWNGVSFSSSTQAFSTASGTSPWRYSLALPADGKYTVSVRATDVLGNVTASNAYVSATFTTDTAPPAAPVITSGTSNPTRDVSPEFEFSDTSSPVTFTCRLDSGASTNCTGDTDHDNDANVQGEWQYSSLAYGAHCFSVFATDAAGNIGPTLTYCWSILAPVPNAIAVSSGSPQSAAINTNFGSALVAKVTNSGNPVSGASVTFTAPASGASGTFASPCSGRTCVVTTNSSGLATAPAFKANATAGSYTVTAANGVATANFSLTNTVKTIAVSSGSPQFTTINTNFGSALVATVTDGASHAISGASVTFTAPASGASGTFASPCSGRTCTVTTNTSGLATAPTFKANGIAGSFTVAATVAGVTAPANFALINTANFTIGGSLASPFAPGLSQSLNLTFTNPNPSPMTIPAGAINITITTSNPTGCPATGNFTVTHGLTAAVTIPANTATPVSLSTLGAPTSSWPVITMINATFNQNLCHGVTVTLHYTGSGNG